MSFFNQEEITYHSTEMRIKVGLSRNTSMSCRSHRSLSSCAKGVASATNAACPSALRVVRIGGPLSLPPSPEDHVPGAEEKNVQSSMRRRDRTEIVDPEAEPSDHRQLNGLTLSKR